jgi:hypothetical protein
MGNTLTAWVWITEGPGKRISEKSLPMLEWPKNGVSMVSVQAFHLHGHHYALYFFSLFWGHVFSAFQHTLGTFCHGEMLKSSLNFSGENVK